MLSLDATNSPERSVPGEALYARSNATVESCLDFRFDKDLDRSVFAKLTGIPGTADSGWNHLQVPWQPDPSKPPRDHFYFQDRMDATAVYFLPDEFRIKRDEASHLPLLSVSVLGDGSRLSLSYVAVPVWDPKRIEAALPQLQRVGVPREVTALRLFAAGNATLRLKLPNGDPQGGPGLVDQSKASVQTDLAISGNVNLAKDDFAAVFRDLLTSASGYLSGEVVVVVDEHTIRLPFVSRATQFVGEVLEVAVDYASATALKLTARNVIESPVVIKKLPILLQRNDKEVALRSSSPTPALPVTLAPANEEHPIGEEVELLLESTDGSLNGTLLYDLSQVTVEVDGDALFNCILDQTLAVHQTRELQINILASLLPPPPSPQAQVNVEVELLGSSGVVIFTSGAPPEGSLFFAKSLLLQIPLRELLLGKTHAAELQNRYRLRYFTAAGPERTGDWIPLKVDEQVLYLSTLPKEGA
jgi:hypothetical protein